MPLEGLHFRPRTLSVDKGELTREAMHELSLEPWIELEMNQIELEAHGKGFEAGSLAECKELLKTPKQRRLERGLDVHLTSQMKTSHQKQQERNKRKVARMSLRRHARTSAKQVIQTMTKDGYSKDQMFAAIVRPVFGKKGKHGKQASAEKTKQRLVSRLLKKSEAKAKSRDAESGVSDGAQDREPKVAWQSY